MPKFSIITSAYNQLDQLKRLRKHLDQQTFEDFEWIVADDGSSDGTEKWANKNADKYVRQEDMGYRLTKIFNKACFEASGEFLVWIMGDSYPYKDFLEKINDHVDENVMLTGIRMNVDNEGRIVGQDWRLKGIDTTKMDYLPIKSEHPWGYMTLNTMVMARSKFEEMGGIDSGYDDGYGKMDWWMAAWSHYNKMRFGWVLDAMVFHEVHKEREDTDNNTKLFYKHIEEFEKDKNANSS